MSNQPQAKIWDKTWKESNKAKITYVTQNIFNEMVKYLSFKNKSVLELGCGTGRLSYLVAKSGAKEIGLVDFSPEALKVARGLFSGDKQKVKLSCFQKDIKEFTINKKYDIVFSSGVVEHFPGNDFEKVVKKHLNLAFRKAVFILPAGPGWNNVRCLQKGNHDRYGWWRPISRQKMMSTLRDLGVTEGKIIHKKFDFLYQFPFASSTRNKNIYRRFANKLSFIDPYLGGLSITIVNKE